MTYLTVMTAVVVSYDVFDCYDRAVVVSYDPNYTVVVDDGVFWLLCN